MNAKISSGRAEKRIPLHTVVPLKAPFTVGISPSELCNFRCVYCNWGTSVGIPGAKILSWDDFIILVEQVKNLYDKANMKCKNVQLYGNGEPLLNQKIVDMVKYINNLDFAERTEIATNASLLTQDLSEALIEAGLTRLIVSIQGLCSEKYREICGYNVDFDDLLKELKYFHDLSHSFGGKCKLHIKTIDVAVTHDERERFYQMFEPICDTMYIDNVIAVYADVDYESVFREYKKDRTRYETPFIARKCCNSLFYHMGIAQNGDISCCACKWPPYVIGNLFNEPLYKIWNCGKHREIMITHLSGLRETLPKCRDCLSLSQYNSAPEDNLDGHMNEILQRIQH